MADTTANYVMPSPKIYFFAFPFSGEKNYCRFNSKIALFNQKW
jgi:hypothetical protein